MYIYISHIYIYIHIFNQSCRSTSWLSRLFVKWESYPNRGERKEYLKPPPRILNPYHTWNTHLSESVSNSTRLDASLPLVNGTLCKQREPGGVARKLWKTWVVLEKKLEKANHGKSERDSLVFVQLFAHNFGCLLGWEGNITTDTLLWAVNKKLSWLYPLLQFDPFAGQSGFIHDDHHFCIMVTMGSL